MCFSVFWGGRHWGGGGAALNTFGGRRYRPEKFKQCFGISDYDNVAGKIVLKPGEAASIMLLHKCAAAKSRRPSRLAYPPRCKPPCPSVCEFAVSNKACALMHMT